MSSKDAIDLLNTRQTLFSYIVTVIYIPEEEIPAKNEQTICCFAFESK